MKRKNLHNKDEIYITQGSFPPGSYGKYHSWMVNQPTTQTKSEPPKYHRFLVRLMNHSVAKWLQNDPCHSARSKFFPFRKYTYFGYELYSLPHNVSASITTCVFTEHLNLYISIPNNMAFDHKADFTVKAVTYPWSSLVLPRTTSSRSYSYDGREQWSTEETAPYLLDKQHSPNIQIKICKSEVLSNKM